MAKAVMVVAGGLGLGTNIEGNFFGSDAFSTTEVTAQINAPVEMTFTKMSGYYTALAGGNSTFTFRNNTATGNQTSGTVTVTGKWEDLVNSDTVTAGNEFNWAHTRTTNNPTMSWAKVTVEMSDANHGNIHGTHNGFGAVSDVDSTTQFFPLGGAQANDGMTEARAQWRNRAYTSWEDIQVYISANARSGDATMTIRNRINGGYGGLTVSIGAGITGFIAATGTPDALADNDLMCWALTLGADSTNDLTIALISSYFKSSSLKSDTIFSSQNGFFRAASATEHFCAIGGRATTTISGNTPITDAQARLAPGFAATVSNFRFYLSTNTYTGTATFTVYKNGVATAMTIAVTSGTGAGWQEYSATTFDIDADDELSIGLVGGTATGANGMSIVSGGLTFAPLASGVTGPLIAGRLVGGGALLGGRLIR